MDMAGQLFHQDRVVTKVSGDSEIIVFIGDSSCSMNGTAHEGRKIDMASETAKEIGATAIALGVRTQMPEFSVSYSKCIP